jgi:hypothetical protein
MSRNTTAKWAIVLSLLAAGCSRDAEPKRDAGAGGGTGTGADPVVIGLSMDTLREERWQNDRDFFVATAESLGARVLVQACNNSDALQNAQCENLLTQGVDVLVVVPHNSKTAATIVSAAHRTGVPVIAYDRMIEDCDLAVDMDSAEAAQQAGGARRSRDLRFPWIHTGLRVDKDRAVSCASTHCQIAHARCAAIDPSRTDAPQASSAAGTGAVAPTSCPGILRIPCRAQEWQTPRSVSGRSATRLDPRAASA